MLKAGAEDRSQESDSRAELHSDAKPLVEGMRDRMHVLEDEPKNKSDILKAKLLSEAIERFGEVISDPQKKAEAQEFVRVYLEKVEREASLADYYRTWEEVERLHSAINNNLSLRCSWEDIQAKRVEELTRQFEADPHYFNRFRTQLFYTHQIPLSATSSEVAKMLRNPQRNVKERHLKNAKNSDWIVTEEDLMNYLVDWNIQRILNLARKYGFEDPESFTLHELDERKKYQDRLFERDEKKPELDKEEEVPAPLKIPGDNSDAVISVLLEDLKQAYPEGIPKEGQYAAVDLIEDFILRNQKTCNIPTYIKMYAECERMITAIKMGLPVRATFKQMSVVNNRRIARAKLGATYLDDSPESSIPDDLKLKYNIHELPSMYYNPDEIEFQIESALKTAKKLGFDSLKVTYGQFMEKLFEINTSSKKEGFVKRARNLLRF